MSILSIVILYSVYKEIFSFIINAIIFDSLYIMEFAIGMARRAMALPDFKLVGPAIHLALPECFQKLSTYLNIFINIFIIFKVNHRKNNKLNH